MDHVKLNDLTTTPIHVARKYFFITTFTGRRVCEAVSHPRVIHGYGAAGNLPQLGVYRYRQDRGSNSDKLMCGVLLRYDVDEPLHTGMGITDVAECTWCTNRQSEFN